jgi:hypothetical protein
VLALACAATAIALLLSRAEDLGSARRLSSQSTQFDDERTMA